jgi:hypothetical protein
VGTPHLTRHSPHSTFIQHALNWLKTEITWKACFNCQFGTLRIHMAAPKLAVLESDNWQMLLVS